MMSDELDIAYEKTSCIMGSTDITVDQGGSGGSDAIQTDGWPMRRVAPPGGGGPPARGAPRPCGAGAGPAGRKPRVPRHAGAAQEGAPPPAVWGPEVQTPPPGGPQDPP